VFVSIGTSDFAVANNLSARALRTYVIVIALLGVCVMLYALLNLNIRYTFLAIGLALTFVIVINPRLAVYQFLFFLFIDYPVIPSVPIYLIDISTMLLVMAAVLDVLLSERLPRRLPPLTFNYLYILAALAVCGLVGYWPQLVAQRLATFTFLIIAFFSIYRLTAKVSLESMLNWFFALAVLHSAAGIAPFVASGGEYRSFGLAGVFFDDITMVALPIGLSLFLGARRGSGFLFLMGSVIVLGGLVATQSRASLLFALAASAFVIYVARKRSGKMLLQSEFRRLVRARLKMIVAVFVTLTTVVLILKAGVLMALFERFEQLFSLDLAGSVGFRLQLWQRAWVAFLDNPIFGVGPGGFGYLIELYPTLHLTPQFYYLRSLGAHNVLLHYLATVGLIGAMGLVVLFINQYRLARRTWSRSSEDEWGPVLAAYSWAFLFILTVLFEAGWMWGHLSFTAIFLAAVVSRQSADRPTVPN